MLLPSLLYYSHTVAMATCKTKGMIGHEAGWFIFSGGLK